MARHQNNPVLQSKPTACQTSTVYDLEPEYEVPGSPRITTLYPDPLPSDRTEGVLLALAKVVEQRDKHTAGHCERLAFTGVALGTAMGLDSASLLSLYLGGYLHDVGKVGIPDAILFKPDQLDAQEWKIMATHAERGEEICRPLNSMRSVLPLIRNHHERWDGTGYPDGLRGGGIPLLARVLQVVDIYDALTNPRCYKAAYSPDRALEILVEETDRGWRDPAITGLFVRQHKNIIAKIAGYMSGGDLELRTMQVSLMNLETFLAT
jgi:HD-GYP domain-containing protein (c-di-GMP phosphodiesterase class II)